MATEFIKLKGKASWAKTKQPNQWDKWVVTLHPLTPDLELIRDMQAKGLKNVIKKDEDGYFTSFNRPTKRVRGNTTVTMDPPTVLNSDGSVFDGMIGNGSDVTITLEVYEHRTPAGGKAIAARLDTIQVDNLVPFTKEPEPDLGLQKKPQVFWKENTNG